MKTLLLLIALLSAIGSVHGQGTLEFIFRRPPSGWPGHTYCTGQNLAQWQVTAGNQCTSVNPVITLHCQVYLSTSDAELRAHEMLHVNIARAGVAKRYAAALGPMGDCSTANQIFNQRTQAIDVEIQRLHDELDRVTEHGRYPNGKPVDPVPVKTARVSPAPVKNTPSVRDDASMQPSKKLSNQQSAHSSGSNEVPGGNSRQQDPVFLAARDKVLRERTEKYRSERARDAANKSSIEAERARKEALGKVAQENRRRSEGECVIKPVMTSADNAKCQIGM